MIFSSPAYSAKHGAVYFGAYDGTLYALDAKTGEKKWELMDADWVGASPAVADDLDLVFAGLEYGLWKKQGALVAIQMQTGEIAWRIDRPRFTYASPVYNKACHIVVAGSNDGAVFAAQATTGALFWEYKTGAAQLGSFAFDDSRKIVCFVSMDGYIHIVDALTGLARTTIRMDAGARSKPCIHNGVLYVTSLDKHVYSINLDTYEIIWKFITSGRIFASPIVANDRLYTGSNDGRLYELDLKTGICTGYFQCAERILNAAAFDQVTKRIFVPTQANEIFCIEL